MFSAQWAAVRTMFRARVSITLPVQCQVVPRGPSAPKNVPTSRVPLNAVACGRRAAAGRPGAGFGACRAASSGRASAMRCAVQNRAACRASCPAEGPGGAGSAAPAAGTARPNSTAHSRATVV